MIRGSSFFAPAAAQDFWVPTWAPRGKFTPNAVNDLSVWLHADLGVVKSGSDLTSWTDQKSAFVGTAENSPQVVPAGFNGKQSIDITGATQAVAFTGANGSWSTATAWTVIAAFDFQPASSAGYETWFGKTDDNNRFRARKNDPENLQAIVDQTAGSTTVDQATGGVTTATGEAIWVLRANGTALDGWRDGTPFSENSATLAAVWDWNDDIRLFNRVTSVTKAALGSNRIWLLYTRALSNDEINLIVNNYIEPETGLSTWSDI